MENSIVRLFLDQIIMDFHIGFLTIIIIRINYHKRLIQNSFCCKYSLTGSPRFGTVCRFLKSSRKIFQRLKCIFYLRDLFDPLPDYTAELLFQIFTNDKYNFIKPCLQSIMNGIIHNDLTIWSYWCKLFDSFSKTASNSGSHNNKCCLFHKNILLMHTGILHLFMHLPHLMNSVLRPGLLLSGCPEFHPDLLREQRPDGEVSA